MNIKELIRAEKLDVDVGKWSFGHIPRSAFPMSKLKDKRYKYGPDYSWRVVRFNALGYKCRILILFNDSKQILRSRFGVDVNGDTVVLCDYEFHATEPGWHCHVTPEDHVRVPPGIARSDKTKWPRNSSRKTFGVEENSALTVVCEHFSVNCQGDLI